MHNSNRSEYNLRIDEFSLCIELKSQGRYKEAIEIYEFIYRKGTMNDVFNYVYCLNKCEQIDKAIKISKELYKGFPDYEKNNNYLSFLLYNKYFKLLGYDDTRTNVNLLIEIAISIVKITKQSTKSASHLILKKLLYLMKEVKFKPNENTVKLLDLIDYTKLEIDYGIDIMVNNNQEQTLAEEFLAYKTKTLFELKMYKECIVCCNYSFEIIKEFHYDNDVWIRTRKGRSLNKIGEYDKALIELNEVKKVNKHWSIYFDIGEVYYNLNEYKKALLYYGKSVMTPDKAEIKIKLYIKISELLYEIGDFENSWRHIFVSISIKQTKRWWITDNEKELYSNLSEYNFSKEITMSSIMIFWIGKLHEILGSNEGYISNINQNGTEGTIFFNDENYSFNKSAIKSPRKLILNEKVLFCLVLIDDETLEDKEKFVCDLIVPMEL